ncbi:helix-turn-helix domain-containing protein [Oceanobacillus senegalensis]|uniref:helix-turn-helix domain-containing protein n=1 Tax=Oceanobacillus senegalensis TaxID=1936063 RepID=UPI000A30BF84|nr:helix-turn-helix transcriptional regulator [Oceanobacillus senegalensis]
MEKEFYLRLEKLCEKNNLFKNEVSRILNFSDSTFSNYVNGHRTPSVTTISKFADLCNVSLDYLIRGKEFQHDESYTAKLNTFNELLEQFKKAGIATPCILESEKWKALTNEDLMDLTNYFNYVVMKRNQMIETVQMFPSD